MGRRKGSVNKPKNSIEDLQYEVAILKAAVKQLIRESRDWRIKNEKAIDVLTDRCQRHLLASYDNGGKLVRDRDLDEKRGAEPGIRAGTV
jgi:hypothetical protein